MQNPGSPQPTDEPPSPAIRDLALAELCTLFGEPLAHSAGHTWTTPPLRPDSSPCTIQLNSPEVPDAAEVTMHLGAANLYQFHARTTDELRQGLEIIRLLSQPR